LLPRAFLPMTSYLNASLSSDRFRTALVLVFGATLLLLVLMGLAGLTARTVAERRLEVGIRMALGAAPSRMWMTTTLDALKSVGGGLAMGIMTAELAFHLVRTILAGVLPPSTLMWVADVALVAVLCALAAGVPAHRVIGVRPSEALRAN
jgi:putative ABC transport system permease protein